MQIQFVLPSTTTYPVGVARRGEWKPILASLVEGGGHPEVAISSQGWHIADLQGVTTMLYYSTAYLLSSLCAKY